MDAIEAYRRELREAGIEEADVAELIDHLLESAREVGAAEAVARLGEPRALAGELGRARPAFGAQLPRARAWSAAALLAPLVALAAWWTFGRGLQLSLGAAEVALGGVLVLALLARLSWARAILFGFTAHVALENAAWAAQVGGTFWALFAAAYLGAAVFLAPWRRGELTRAGWTLAAVAFGFPGVSLAFALAGVPGALALVTFTVGAAGVLLCARWSAPLLAAAALLLVSPGAGLLARGAWLWGAAMLASAVALALGARAAWQSSSRGWGRLRALAR